MTRPTYPLDTTGSASTNLIPAELHTLSEINEDTYRIIIPTNAPFFVNNFQLTFIEQTGDRRVMFEDVDYSFCLPYVGATRSIGMPVYGGIKILNEHANGTLSVKYQTIGDKWVADAQHVLQMLVESVSNPRLAYWDNLSNVQETFPPINHPVEGKDLYGFKELIDAVNLLQQAILTGPNTTLSAIKHLLDETNPHATTKAQVGLADVENLQVAQVSELTSISPPRKYVTAEHLLTAVIKPIHDRLTEIENQLGL